MFSSILGTDDYLHLSYDPDLALLAVRWQRDVSFAEVQEGMRAAREMSYSHGASRWLIDVRCRAQLDAAVSGWVVTTLLPAVANELAPAMLCVAYLFAPDHIAVLQQNPAMRAATVTAQTHPAYKLQLFQDEKEAISWMAS
ncbi:STAS/SEC14 domain-containing protein [Hymenobacter lapidiphilus]|uniref:STAS/SEC14 domain-containing protein n=1 Tax=Hymenobacter lapidiphilus TaxID=2608003 RepID=A0A7Y7PMD9_9BACT|nr:STAS/SEC14 domain-containing protein [Hymenobacter lapidiphilus]NVO30486.1 STAS/SEC14 domain-containing protein [Hymenobacter lapidiphilus]